MDTTPAPATVDATLNGSVDGSVNGSVNGSAPVDGAAPTAQRPTPARRLRARLQREADAYSNGEERPLGGYLKLMSVYGAGTVGAGILARATGRSIPRLSPWDMVQLATATHRLSRTIAKDPVTSPLRAPFTTYAGLSAPSELHEEVRGHGWQHSFGELLTCPMCLAQWVATGFAYGLVFAPTPTRLMMSVFTAVAGADALQYAYAALQQAAE